MLVLLDETPTFCVMGSQDGKVFHIPGSSDDVAAQMLIADWPEVKHVSSDNQNRYDNFLSPEDEHDTLIEMRWVEGECEGVRYKLRCGFTTGLWLVGKLVVL